MSENYTTYPEINENGKSPQQLSPNKPTEYVTKTAYSVPPGKRRIRDFNNQTGSQNQPQRLSWKERGQRISKGRIGVSPRPLGAGGLTKIKQIITELIADLPEMAEVPAKNEPELKKSEFYRKLWKKILQRMRPPCPFKGSDLTYAAMMAELEYIKQTGRIYAKVHDTYKATMPYCMQALKENEAMRKVYNFLYGFQHKPMAFIASEIRLNDFAIENQSDIWKMTLPQLLKQCQVWMDENGYPFKMERNKEILTFTLQSDKVQTDLQLETPANAAEIGFMLQFMNGY